MLSCDFFLTHSKVWINHFGFPITNSAANKCEAKRMIVPCLLLLSCSYFASLKKPLFFHSTVHSSCRVPNSQAVQPQSRWRKDSLPSTRKVKPVLLSGKKPNVLVFTAMSTHTDAQLLSELLCGEQTGEVITHWGNPKSSHTEDGRRAKHVTACSTCISCLLRWLCVYRIPRWNWVADCQACYIFITSSLSH